MATARLNLIGEKFSFKVNDNPLIHGLDEKLEMGLKQFVDFLKTDEYRGYVVWNGVCGMEWGTQLGNDMEWRMDWGMWYRTFGVHSWVWNGVLVWNENMGYVKQ